MVHVDQTSYRLKAVALACCGYLLVCAGASNFSENNTYSPGGNNSIQLTAEKAHALVMGRTFLSTEIEAKIGDIDISSNGTLIYTSNWYSWGRKLKDSFISWIRYPEIVEFNHDGMRVVQCIDKFSAALGDFNVFTYNDTLSHQEVCWESGLSINSGHLLAALKGELRSSRFAHTSYHICLNSRPKKCVKMGSLKQLNGQSKDKRELLLSKHTAVGCVTSNPRTGKSSVMQFFIPDTGVSEEINIDAACVDAAGAAGAAGGKFTS